MPIKKLLLIVTCQLSLILILSGCKAVGSTKPAALQITTTPETSVFLDGKHVGKSPFFSDQLKAKEYLVKLTAGEATYVGKINLSAGTLTVINRELNNNFLAQSGEVLWLEKGSTGIFIVSMPGEATISLDGELVGTTPKKIDNLPEGEHKITLSKQGYIDREFAVKTSNKYQLTADVTLASQTAKDNNPTSTQKPQALQPQMVEVIDTPQGFLRVRKEPTTTSAEVGRVEDGDKFELIQEDGDWVQIKFEDKQGWVSSQYVEKTQ